MDHCVNSKALLELSNSVRDSLEKHGKYSNQHQIKNQKSKIKNKKNLSRLRVVDLIEVYGPYPTHTWLVHEDSIDDIHGCHGLLVMRDDDEL